MSKIQKIQNTVKYAKHVGAELGAELGAEAPKKRHQFWEQFPMTGCEPDRAGNGKRVRE